MSLLAQRFTLTPVDPKIAGKPHPQVVPITPEHGMLVYVD